MDPSRIDELAAKAKTIGEAALPPLLDTTELHSDGDYICYYFSGNDDTSFGDAKANVVRSLAAVRRIAGAGGRSVVHLTAPGSHKGHRYAIATVKPYQGQRDAGRKPKNWQALRDWLEDGSGLKAAGHGLKVWQDREADDGVALSARYAWSVGRLPAVFSRDKDFRMIPGRHVSWTTLGLTEVKPETWAVEDEDGLVFGAKWFWMQMLSGDTADNIPGLPKQPTEDGEGFKTCGDACAKNWLADANSPEDAWQLVRSLYRRYYAEAWASAFTEQAALLWLRTDADASVGDFLKAIPAKSPELEAAVRQLERRVNQ